MRIIETKAYQFNELSPEAQARAIKKWQDDEAGSGDNYWSEYVIEEAAHYDELPRDLPYHGFHGPGGNYGAHHLACDGKQYADVETGHDGGYLIHWNDATRQPDEPSLRRIHEYLAILESARQQLTTNQG